MDEHQREGGTARLPTQLPTGLLGLLVLGLAFAVFAQEPARDTGPQAAPRSVLVELDTAITKLLEDVRPAVVGIVAQQTLAGIEVRQSRKISLSGTVWDDTGAIVSFGRDLASATTIEVSPGDGKGPIPARFVGVDGQTDIALIQADLGGRARPLAKSSRLLNGALVVTVGNPFGLERSTALTTIAGLKRSFSLGSVSFDDAFQFNNSVHPGDPGGPVANARGELLGIMASSLRSSPLTGPAGRTLDELFPGAENALRERLSRSGAQGIGFALPIATIEAALGRIRDAAKRPRVWLGVEVIPLPEVLRRRFELGDEHGVLVMAVISGSSADQGGLRVQDIVLRWNDQKISDTYQLRTLVLAGTPGNRAQLLILREGKQLSLDIELKSRN